MVVEPEPAPVTGTATLELFCGIVMVAGTVATPMLSELKFTTVPPAGASAESVKVRFCVALEAKVRVTGVNARVAVT